MSKLLIVDEFPRDYTRLATMLGVELKQLSELVDIKTLFSTPQVDFDGSSSWLAGEAREAAELIWRRNAQAVIHDHAGSKRVVILGARAWTAFFGRGPASPITQVDWLSGWVFEGSIWAYKFPSLSPNSSWWGHIARCERAEALLKHFVYHEAESH